MSRKRNDVFFESTIAREHGHVEVFTRFFELPSNQLSKYMSAEFVRGAKSCSSSKWTRAERSCAKWLLRDEKEGFAFEVLIPKGSALPIEDAVDAGALSIEEL